MSAWSPMGGCLLAAALALAATPPTAAGPDSGRQCIPLARAFDVAERHRGNGALITVLTKPDEVARWYGVVARSAAEADDETPVFVIVIGYPEVTYAHLGNGPAVCRGAAIPSPVAREALEAARGGDA
jgi:hypothetical protein